MMDSRRLTEITLLRRDIVADDKTRKIVLTNVKVRGYRSNFGHGAYVITLQGIK